MVKRGLSGFREVLNEFNLFKYFLNGLLIYFQLTSIHNFAKKIFAARKVSRGAVPATIPELMLALADGQVGALDQGSQYTGIIPDQATLLSP